MYLFIAGCTSNWLVFKESRDKITNAWRKKHSSENFCEMQKGKSRLCCSWNLACWCFSPLYSEMCKCILALLFPPPLMLSPNPNPTHTHTHTHTHTNTDKEAHMANRSRGNLTKMDKMHTAVQPKLPVTKTFFCVQLITEQLFYLS